MVTGPELKLASRGGLTLREFLAVEFRRYLPAGEAARKSGISQAGLRMRLIRAKRKRPDLFEPPRPPLGRAINASQLGSVDCPFSLDSIF